MDVDNDNESESVYQAENAEQYTLVEDKQKEYPKYVMVQFDKLMDLHTHCYRCGHRPKFGKPTVKFCGTAFKTKIWCNNCKDYVKWESQERVPERKMYVGNIEIASAVAAAPISLSLFLQFAQILNLAMFDRSTFYNYMPTFWTVICDAYDKMQQKVVKYIQDKDDDLHIAADGQYDSRGFSALQCCVTVMDAVSRLIIATVCLNKDKEKCASNNLEHRGLEKALNEVIGKGLHVISLTTDRRMQNKRSKDFQLWCQAFLNHLWYSVTAANGAGSLCQQYGVSALLHSIGIHEWTEGIFSEVLHDNQAAILGVDPDNILKNDPLDMPGKLIDELSFVEHLSCKHDDENTGRKTLLHPDSLSYRVLLKAFTNDGFLNDLERLSPKLATSALEGFHGLVSNIYRSKNHYLNLEGFTNRTKLAVLHYNNNVFDEISGKRKVVRETKMKAKHRGGDIVTKQLNLIIF
uniref:Transposase n=1 Tax=Panagrolaimus superbus TaxID=310955 RepID=A0A914Y8Z2_9BILA